MKLPMQTRVTPGRCVWKTHSVRLILAILAPLQLCARELDLADNTSDGSADEISYGRSTNWPSGLQTRSGANADKHRARSVRRPRRQCDKLGCSDPQGGL